MSRDLKREYRAFANSAAPDLWARIERGIELKNSSYDIDYMDPAASQNNGRKRFHYGAWITVAAACLCAAVAIPVMTRSLFGGRKSGNMTAAPETFEGGSVSDDTGAGAANDTVSGSNINTSPTLSGGAGLKDAQNELAVDSAADFAVTATEAYGFMATVEILDAGEEYEDRIVYTVNVLDSEDNELPTNSEIKVYAFFDGEAIYEISQTYDVMLRGENVEEEVWYQILE